MDVAGEGRHPARSHVLAVAKEGGIAVAEASRTIDDMLECLSPNNFREETKNLPVQKNTLKHVMQVIEANRKRLRL